jgi:hypothetical protein
MDEADRPIINNGDCIPAFFATTPYRLSSPHKGYDRSTTREPEKLSSYPF